MKLASLLFVAAILSGCVFERDHAFPVITDVPIAVRNAPDTIQVDGQPIVLSAYLSRDFMPPADGRPMAVSVAVAGVDPSVMTAGYRFLSLWVVRGDRAWFARLEPQVSIPEIASVHAGGGPRWSPDEVVYVAARLWLPEGREVMLAVRGARIQRTD